MDLLLEGAIIVSVWGFIIWALVDSVRDRKRDRAEMTEADLPTIRAVLRRYARGEHVIAFTDGWRWANQHTEDLEPVLPSERRVIDWIAE